MKSISALTNITRNYLKTGNSPRFFVHVATSERKWATVAANSYTNRIQRVQSITDQIDAFGGMGTVSSASVDILKLGEEIKFYNSATLYPKDQGANVGAGRIYDRDDVYLTTRGQIVGDVCSFVTMIVGRRYSVSSPYYTTYRSFVQFDLSTLTTPLTTCEEAYLNLSGTLDSSATDFELYLVRGLWLTGGLSASEFDSFSGWAGSGTNYTGTILNETFSTSAHYSTSATNRIRFNRAGRQEIVDYAGGVLKLMILSSRDYTYTAALTGDEMVRFAVVEDSTPTLELIYNTVKPDNERARIYLCYNDASSGIPAAVSSMLNVWSGVVDNWALDQKTLSLDMRHDDFKRNTKLTADVIKREDTGYAYCPDDNIGKAIPVVIGDFTGDFRHSRSFGSFIEKTGSNRWGNGDHIKGYVYDEQSADLQKKIVFAGHAFKTIGTYIGMYDISLESIVPIPGTVATTGVGKVVLTVGSTATFPYVLNLNSANKTVLNPIATDIPCFAPIASYATLYNPMYAIDNNSTNYATLTGAGIGRYSVNSFSSPGTIEDPVAIVMESYSTGGYTAGGAHFSATWLKADGTGAAGSSDIFMNADAQYVYYANNIDQRYGALILVHVTSGYSDIKPFGYRNIAVYSGYVATSPIEVYMRCSGVADDASGTYTGIPTTLPLIENPSDVIRWFAMVKGGYTAGEIDSSFTTARADLSGWEFAFQWNDDAGIENLFNFEGQKGIVDELAAQCNSIVWENHEGKLKMRVFDPTDAFPVSGTDVPADLDMFEYEGSPSSGSLTRHPIFSFNLSRMTVDETYNDFVLKYKQNYATNGYDSVLTIDNGLGVSGSVSHNITSSNLRLTSPWFNTAAKALTELKDLTSSCYTDINTTNTLVHEAWAIRDAATATKLLQKLVEWHARRRFKITLTTGLNALRYELGDFINVRTDDIEDQFGTASMNCKKWKITKLTTDLSACKIELEAIEADIR